MPSGIPNMKLIGKINKKCSFQLAVLISAMRKRVKKSSKYKYWNFVKPRIYVEHNAKTIPKMKLFETKEVIEITGGHN